MRSLFYLLMFISVSVYSQEFTIVQINAKWNDIHTIKLPRIAGVNTQFAYLEDQPESIKSRIKAVPVLVLYKGSKPVKQWTADLSFKLHITEEEIRKALIDNN